MLIFVLSDKEKLFVELLGSLIIVFILLQNVLFLFCLELSVEANILYTPKC